MPSNRACTLILLKPRTGFDAVWLVIAAFALVMAGGALLRIAPRRQA